MFSRSLLVILLIIYKCSICSAQSALEKQYFEFNKLNSFFDNNKADILWLGHDGIYLELYYVVLNIIQKVDKPVTLFLEINYIYEMNLNNYIKTGDCKYLSFIDTIENNYSFSDGLIQLLDSIRKIDNVQINCYKGIHIIHGLNTNYNCALTIQKHLKKERHSVVLSNLDDAKLQIASEKLDTSTASTSTFLANLTSPDYKIFSIALTPGNGNGWFCDKDTCGINSYPDNTYLEESFNRQNSFGYIYGEFRCGDFQWDAFLYLKKVNASLPFNYKDCK
jgi:hypothetical protein